MLHLTLATASLLVGNAPVRTNTRVSIPFLHQDKAATAIQKTVRTTAGGLLPAQKENQLNRGATHPKLHRQG